jgi:predicted GH43/DUF377 family glycosyl hydrolase
LSYESEVGSVEESDVFNPGAVVNDGKIFILYRAEDNSSVGIASRVSRIGLAETSDGFTMKKRPAPVVYPITITINFTNGLAVAKILVFR